MVETLPKKGQGERTIWLGNSGPAFFEGDVARHGRPQGAPPYLHRIPRPYWSSSRNGYQVCRSLQLVVKCRLLQTLLDRLLETMEEVKSASLQVCSNF